MNILKKIISFCIILTIIIPFQMNKKNSCSTFTTNQKSEPKISVLVSSLNIAIWKSYSENMEKIEKENPGTIHYTFYDGKGDQNIQLEQLKSILNNRGADLLMLDPVDSNFTKNIIDIIKQYNIPVIFMFNSNTEAVKSYGRAYFVGTNPSEGGVLVGNIIADAWKKNKTNIDKNQNNVLEYIMLLGTPNNIYSDGTATYSIRTLNDDKIKTQELASKYCNWSEQEAQNAIKQYFLSFGNKIEAIIAVEDGMAIGAVKALQQYGYNLGDNRKKVIVVGVNGTPEALNLIKNGYMTGTAILDPYQIAKNFYAITINILNNRNIIDGTNCTADITGKIITINFSGVEENLS